MQALNTHFETQLTRHQIQIDREDYEALEREELELEAEQDFDKALATRDINTEVPRTEMRDVNNKRRLQTLDEIIWDYLYDADLAKKFTQAFLHCVAKGNVEAVEVMNEIKAKFIEDRCNTGIPK